MRNRSHRVIAALAIAGLIAASCGSDDDSGDSASTTDAAATTDATETTEATETTDAPEATDAPESTDAPDSTEAPESTDAAESDGDEPEDFATLGPATGEPIVVGMVNTEGTPGLDFPEFRTDTDLAVDYLNEHGGFGGRPVEVEHCAAAGSPETSQACAQELAGKGVELVMLGLDLFPGYDTFEASGIPVFGALPILPGDYTANALFITGGNATTTAAMVGLAVENFDAQSIGIISADNAGANGTEAALIAAIEKQGIPYKSVKGGDNETDAGYQGLLREANSDNPELLVSLYADAGCIGVMRARATAGIETPMVSTAICSSAEVIDVVGDDAVGWSFVAVGTPNPTAAEAAFDEIITPVYGSGNGSSLGLGALGITQVMTLARVANAVVAEGGEVTGSAMFDRLATSSDILNFPDDNPLECGLAPEYPTICSFVFPLGEYIEGGEIRTIPGFEAFNVSDYLP